MAEPEIGVIYTGKVVKTAEFGAFVNFLGAKDGLVHISELANERVAKITDVVKDGDEVKVKVIGFDDRGKVKLSMRVVDQATGADITEQVGAKPPARRWRGRSARERGERPTASGRDRGRARRGGVSAVGASGRRRLTPLASGVPPMRRRAGPHSRYVAHMSPVTDRVKRWSATP